VVDGLWLAPGHLQCRLVQRLHLHVDGWRTADWRHTQPSSGGFQYRAPSPCAPWRLQPREVEMTVGKTPLHLPLNPSTSDILPHLFSIPFLTGYTHT
jgi:hypothetical protein